MINGNGQLLQLSLLTECAGLRTSCGRCKLNGPISLIREPHVRLMRGEVGVVGDKHSWTLGRSNE